MGCFMTEGFKRTRRFQEGLSYEQVMTSFMGSIAQWRVYDPRQYAAAVETLILMCPQELTEKGQKHLSQIGLRRCDYQHISNDKMRLYDDLWLFMKQLLEKDNLIYRTSYVKTYE